MNVLIFPSWYPSMDNPLNGVFFREQALALQKAGVNVYVLVLNCIGGIRYSLRNFVFKSKRHYYDDDGVKTYKINYINYFSSRFSPKLVYWYNGIVFKRFFKFIEHSNTIQMDIVHIHSATDAGIYYYFSKINRKYVITEHSTGYCEKLISPLQAKYLPFVFSSASHIIAVGNGLIKDLHTYTTKSIDIVFNIVSMNKYFPMEDSNKKSFRFFSLGLDAHRKGMDILINAFAGSPICKSTELYIAGLEQSEIASLKTIITDNDLMKNIQLSGKLSREEVAYYMYNSDCFVLTSRFETFGVVFVEAMYFGKPVISSMTGGPDTYITKETGLLVPVEDVSATREAMEKMFFNYNKYDKEYIKKYAKDNFSEEIITKKIINIYHNVIGEK
jgi:glycosyltransferase involved in cell wall biosynthesis